MTQQLFCDVCICSLCVAEAIAMFIQMGSFVLMEKSNRWFEHSINCYNDGLSIQIMGLVLYGFLGGVFKL